MYLRRHGPKKGEETYAYWTLVEPVRGWNGGVVLGKFIWAWRCGGA